MHLLQRKMAFSCPHPEFGGSEGSSGADTATQLTYMYFISIQYQVVTK